MVESAFGLELNFAEIKLHLSALFEKFRITLTFFDKNTHLLPPPPSPVFLKFKHGGTITMKTSHF